MKNSNLVNAGIVGALFLVFKFIEMRFITKENIPPKQLVRDAIIVFISVLLGQYFVYKLIMQKVENLLKYLQITLLFN